MKLHARRCCWPAKVLGVLSVFDSAEMCGTQHERSLKSILHTHTTLSTAIIIALDDDDGNAEEFPQGKPERVRPQRAARQTHTHAHTHTSTRARCDDDADERRDHKNEVDIEVLHAWRGHKIRTRARLVKATVPSCFTHTRTHTGRRSDGHISRYLVRDSSIRPEWKFWLRAFSLKPYGRYVCKFQWALFLQYRQQRRTQYNTHTHTVAHTHTHTHSMQIVADYATTWWACRCGDDDPRSPPTRTRARVRP